MIDAAQPRPFPIHGPNTYEPDPLPTPVHGSKVRENYTITISRLVADIFAMLSRSNINERSQLDSLTAQIRSASKKTAELYQEKGDMDALISAVAVFVFLGSFACSAKPDRDFVQMISQQVPHLGSMSSEKIQANLSEVQMRANLLLSKYQTSSQKEMSNSSAKQDAQQLLQAAIAGAKEASRQ